MDKDQRVVFDDFVHSIDRIGRAALTLSDRIDGLDDGRPLVPVVRSAVERAAVDLEEAIGAETPFRQPADMIEEEWEEPSLTLLRASIATLELRASQRTADLRDWMRDVSLAIDHFVECRARFERDVER